MFDTLQDRLPKELKLAGIGDVAAAVDKTIPLVNRA
jgi:hypothetical protein